MYLGGACSDSLGGSTGIPKMNYSEGGAPNAVGVYEMQTWGTEN